MDSNIESKQQTLYCDCGEHIVSRENHWSVNGFPLCGDCMDCTSQKEIQALEDSVPRKEMYIFVLDFEDGQVIRYDVSNVREECYEDILELAGHSLSNIQWMATEKDQIKTHL